MFVSLQSFSQLKNKTYNLYYFNDKASSIYQTAMWFRNDTLFIEQAAIVNVININRIDSTNEIIPLGQIRDHKVNVTFHIPDKNKQFLKNPHFYLSPDKTIYPLIANPLRYEKDTIQENKQKETGKNTKPKIRPQY